MPIYKATNAKTGDPIALIDARLPSQAYAHAARSAIKIEVAKPIDLIDLTKAGIELETVGSAGQQLEIDEPADAAADDDRGAPHVG